MVKVWKVTGGEVERQARMVEIRARRDAVWSVFVGAYPGEAVRLEELRALEVGRSGACGLAGEAMYQFQENLIDADTLIGRLTDAEDAFRGW